VARAQARATFPKYKMNPLIKKPSFLFLALCAALAPACNKIEEAPAAPKVQAKEETPAPTAQAAGKPRTPTAKELSEKQLQFNKLDTDNNGSLILEEYLSIVDIPERVGHFKRLDANENGSLTFEEFSTPPHINGR
jgi:flagellar motility protein MotE (MotC chaperone)